MEREPLEDWLFRTSYWREHDTREREVLRQDLTQLETWLDTPPITMATRKRSTTIGRTTSRNLT
jgi:hypothetical protein